MKFKCPNCGTPVDASALRDGDRVVCENCRKRLKLPANDLSMEIKKDESETIDYTMQSSIPQEPVAPPVTQPPSVPPANTAYPYAPGMMTTMPANQPPVMVIPMAVPHQSPELMEEQLEDLRESRSERKERRSYYNLDRKGNAIGMTSFALAISAAIFAMPGFLFVKDLPIFTLLSILVGLPLTMAALPCGIVGCLKTGRNKLYALIGAISAGFLFIIIYPGLMLLLKQRWS